MRGLTLLSLTAVLALAGAPALAQSSSGAEFSRPYGTAIGSETRPYDGARGPQGNRVVINGIIQTGVGVSAQASAVGSVTGSVTGGRSCVGDGAAGTGSGAGGGFGDDGSGIAGNGAAGTDAKGDGNGGDGGRLPRASEARRGMPSGTLHTRRAVRRLVAAAGAEAPAAVSIPHPLAKAGERGRRGRRG